MAEYIDRDIAIAKMTDLFVEFPDEIGYYLQGRCIGLLLFETAADVIEVIRCDNCKRTFITAKGEIWCRKNRGWRKKIDYCSYGERKTND